VAKRRRAPRRAARRSRRTLTILLVLVLVSITVISLDESGRTHGLTSGIKSLATDVFSPVRSGVNGVLRPVGDLFAGAVHYGSLQQENQKLRAQIGALQQQVADGPFQRRQQSQLQQLLAEARLPTVSSIPSVVAQTIAKSPSDFTVTITIDKGRSQGVAVTDPVIGGGGLVGKVVQASHDTATVLLITAGQSEVGVTFASPPQYAVAAGQGQGKLLSGDYISPATPVRVGEKMYTNGLAGAAYPKGIPVAQVTSAKTLPGAAQKTVRMRPLADLATLAYVLVLQWSPAP
jgi:rod shape-determining protein MreC